MVTFTLPVLGDQMSEMQAAPRSPFPLAHRKQFIKQFTGPDEGSGVVCFKFWQLVHASGCPFRCAYCFLQTTAFFRFNKAALMGLVYTNWQEMMEEVKDWLTAPMPRMLIVGELQDGLAFDSAYAAVTGKPLTHHLIPLFATQNRHRLIFLTKSTLIKHALKLESTPQVVFSWSVNSEYVGRRWEQGAPLPSRRFAAASKIQEAGWPIRFRLDPMVPYQDCEDTWTTGYAEAVDRINALTPEMVTIGALRASSMGLVTAARKNERPTDLFDYLSEKDPSGFKYRLPFQKQVEMYKFALERLDRKRIIPALCKEDVSVWKAVGLRFDGCHCLLEGNRVPSELVSTKSFKKVIQGALMAQLPKMVPHTAAKHLLLKKYLDAWFPILGKHHARINYVDGFAGPGDYEDGDVGSPILAIEAAKAHVSKGTLAPNVNINFIFVEAKPDHADHLRSRLDALTIPAQFKVGVIPGEFADAIGGILDELEKERKQIAPTFAFVDPFGFSGIPFALMTRILAYPRCEVFINIMVEFINRFLKHPNDKVVAHFPTTFGTDEVLKIPTQAGDRVKALLSLYKKQLRTKAKYVGQFDMHGRKDQQTYSLFFASNSPLGFQKMKEAMWSVDKAEGGKFSDFEPGAVNQPRLFTLEAVWSHMLDHFRGRLVMMADVERFVIEQTDYLPKHAREVLVQRETAGEVSVKCTAGYKRKKGTFKADKVSIQFPA